jgi:hypothetical protein
MKWKLLLTLAIMTFTRLTSAFSAELTPASEAEARAVLMRYFSALSAGDTETIGSLLEGPLLAKRARLLENSTYPGHLIETYGRARFSIDHIETLGADIIADVSILYDGSNTSHRQYQLHKESAASDDNPSSLRIYGESEPEM